MYYNLMNILQINQMEEKVLSVGFVYVYNENTATRPLPFHSGFCSFALKCSNGCFYVVL